MVPILGQDFTEPIACPARCAVNLPIRFRIAAMEDHNMLPSNRTDASAKEAQYNEGGPDHSAPDPSVLVELRKDLAAIVADLTKVVEHRAAQAKAGAAGGIDAAASMIRSHPVASVAVAVLLGAGVAVAILPSSRPSRRSSLARDWALPAMPAAFVQTVRDLPSSVASSSTLSSLASAFERVVEHIATVDPKSSLTPALEKAGVWLNGFRATMGAK